MTATATGSRHALAVDADAKRTSDDIRIEPPWGLYVHIPFCASICPYCDFNVHLRRGIVWPSFADALRAELRYAARCEFASAPPLHSIYFGGGTPSLAPPTLIAAVIDEARQIFGLEPDAEITLEAMPKTTTHASLAGYRDAGVNRLSAGWQSTHDRLLTILGRQHRAADSTTLLEQAQAAGFANLSMDLIFAVPSQSCKELRQDLEAIITHDPAHVSLYALTYHPGTPFHRRRARGQLHPASEGLEVSMMSQIETMLVAAGYQHYEVSNYSKPGAAAHHNTLYWQARPYLGIGPGAQSFVADALHHGRRWEATRSPQAYTAHWQTNPNARAVSWEEELDSTALFRERLMCAMRHTQGLDLADPSFAPHAKNLAQAIPQAQAQAWATLKGSHLRPTSKGLQHSDALAALFF